MFRTRLISGIILVILAVIVVSTGGALLYGVTAVISLVGMFELYRVMGIEKKSLGLVGYLAGISYYGLLWFDGQKYVTLMAIADPDLAYDNLCVYVSTLRDRTGDGVFLWHLLSGSDAFLPVPGEGDGGRKISGLADFPEFMGMRYLRLLRRNAVWQAQTDTGAEPEKDDRGSRGRNNRGGCPRIHLCIHIRPQDG